MPPPVVFVHAGKLSAFQYFTLRMSNLNLLSERSIDTSLCCYSVRSSGKELRYTGGVESSFSETESCSQPSSSGSNNDGIIFVIDDRVFAGDEA
jgi:hypothetical protein